MVQSYVRVLIGGAAAVGDVIAAGSGYHDGYVSRCAMMCDVRDVRDVCGVCDG